MLIYCKKYILCYNIIEKYAEYNQRCIILKDELIKGMSYTYNIEDFDLVIILLNYFCLFTDLISDFYM